jgi:hypothetical protein
MKPHWIRRRSHSRHFPNGRSTYVRECWVLYSYVANQRHGSYHQECPYCGAKIISVNMPRGGWAHFEGARGLTRVKHPCLHVGEGLSRRRDDQTPDLFAHE